MEDTVSYSPPASGTPIEKSPDGGLAVPNDPVLPYIEGDGTGPDIWKASRAVFDGAVELAYGGERRVRWYEILAGEKAFRTARRVAARRRPWRPSAATGWPSRAR